MFLSPDSTSIRRQGLKNIERLSQRMPFKKGRGDNILELVLVVSGTALPWQYIWLGSPNEMYAADPAERISGCL